MSKDIVSANVRNIKNLFQAEIDRQNAIKDSNSAKAIRKCEFVLHLLDTVPDDITFTVEGCRGDNARTFNLANTGSIVECIVKYHLHHTDAVVKTWAVDAVDTTRGFTDVEIKASLTCNSLATPSENEYTILVNAVGVWSIKKADVMNYVNARGRLPFNKPCGRRLVALSRVMGYDEEVGE